MSVLQAEGLKKRYRGRTVLADVSLKVESGQVVGLLGPNGAGKTTCFYTLVGLVGLDGGRITLDDRDISHEPVYRRARLGMSYLPQENSIFRRLTVAENIAAVLELQGHDEKTVETQLQYLLDDLHIDHLRDSLAVSLSGGERRRAEIARTLATRPRFVLFDEPFAGIDPISVIDIQKIVRFLVERDIGVIITDHNVRETLSICDYTYILNEGHVLAAGTPDEIVRNEAVRELYLGEQFKF